MSSAKKEVKAMDGKPKPSVKQKKKKKNNNVSKGKKMVPLQLFAAPGGFRGIDTDEVDASVQYAKSITGAVEIRIQDIANRGATAMSYDLGMILPGYGAYTSEGVLCDLMGSTYLLTNPSPYTLTVRMQRPMGFRDDCSSLAMWEPIGGVLVHEIRPKGVLKLGSSNGASDHMVPREFTINGKRAVHILSFAVYKEPLTDFGTDPKNKGEVGLIIEAITRYKCMNGDQGQMEGYVVESFNGANRLNHVTVGPLLPLRFCDINMKSGPVSYVSVEKSTNSANLMLSFSADGVTFGSDIDLDTSTVYRFNTGIMMTESVSKKPAFCNYIKFKASGADPSSGDWYVGLLGGSGQRPEFSAGVIDNKAYIPLVMAADEWLYPVTAAMTKSSVRSFKRGGIVAVQHNSLKMKNVEHLLALDTSVFTVFVKALVVIYEVTKLSVEILGVVGVLENPDLKDIERLVTRIEV